MKSFLVISGFCLHLATTSHSFLRLQKWTPPHAKGLSLSRQYEIREWRSRTNVSWKTSQTAVWDRFIWKIESKVLKLMPNVAHRSNAGVIFFVMYFIEENTRKIRELCFILSYRYFIIKPKHRPKYKVVYGCLTMTSVTIVLYKANKEGVYLRISSTWGLGHYWLCSGCLMLQFYRVLCIKLLRIFTRRRLLVKPGKAAFLKVQCPLFQYFGGSSQKTIELKPKRKFPLSCWARMDLCLLVGAAVERFNSLQSIKMQMRKRRSRSALANNHTKPNIHLLD